MRSVPRNDPCPCGSGLKFKRCCGPILQGSPAPDAHALMRSRYTAYVVGDAPHLWATTHPYNEAVAGRDRPSFLLELAEYCREVEFQRLTVDRVWPPDGRGIARVAFRAELLRGGQRDVLSEISDFVQVNGRWLYLAGVSGGGQSSPVLPGAQ